MSQLEESRKLLIKIREEHPDRDTWVSVKEHYDQIGEGHSEKKKKLLLVVGTRPNFIKAAPVMRTLQKYDSVEYCLVHTGQHYDYCMSEVFFKGLKIPKPDINLEMKSTTYAALGMMMDLFEQYCFKEKPDVVLVFGDVDSTLACALVAAKLEGIKLAHVEAGERSFDMSMPEEINRIAIDRLSDYCFCSSHQALEHLATEGLEGIITGNVMVDSLLYNLETIKGLSKDRGQYALVTIHRQSNVDTKEDLANILEVVSEVSMMIPVIFPIHPRTLLRIKQFDLQKYLGQVKVVQPMGYLEFLSYVYGATMVLTDSGGIQVEASVLNVPCLTLRENTEWIDTLVYGTNILVGLVKERVLDETSLILTGGRKHCIPNALWDGKTAEIIVEELSRRW